MNEQIQDLWSQYRQLTDLHKFYFENIIKSASFSMGIIGAITTYAVSASASEKTSIGLLPILLLFPAIVSGGSACIYLLGTWKAWDLSKSIQRVQRRLDVDWRPHAEGSLGSCGVPPICSGAP